MPHDSPTWKSRFPYYQLFPVRSISDNTITIGLLPGEGIGPSVTSAALKVLDSVANQFGFSVNIMHGGPIGKEAERQSGAALTEDVAQFCRDVFAAQGVVLAGAGGGRFVYELRRELDLFCKLAPITPFLSLRNASRFLPDYLARIELLIVRDNLGGIYQGQWQRNTGEHGSSAAHQFEYTAQQISDVVRVGARAARQRNSKLVIIHKESGMPAISELWRECAEELCAHESVPFEMLDVDYAAYKIVAEADSLDVIVAPNLFGDVLGDLAAGLLPSRGNAYSASYRHDGGAVYQTNHGAAFELAGKDMANPAAQMLAVAMMLAESFGMPTAASQLVRAIESVWASGFRTFDIAEPGCHVIGTAAMTDKTCEALEQLSPPSPTINPTHSPVP